MLKFSLFPIKPNLNIDADKSVVPLIIAFVSVFILEPVSNVNSIINRINERLELISIAQGNKPGQFADQTREGSGDNQVITPNPDPNNPDPNNPIPPDLNSIFEKAFGVN